MKINHDSKLRAMINEADGRNLEGRLNRLRFLLDSLGEDYVRFPAIVLEYFEETKLCFYEGAFVASILMASATFEEVLRQIYRDANDMKKANANGLANLVNFAVKDRLISLDEARALTELRRLRNKFTHISIGFKKKRTLLDFMLLWGDHHGEKLPIEALAKDAVEIFAQILPKLCRRFWG